MVDIDLTKDYKINPAVYNHMSEKEQGEYKLLINNYNSNPNRKGGGIALIIYGIFAFGLGIGIQIAFNNSLLSIIGIIMISFGIYLLINKTKNVKLYTKIKELEDIVLYRIKHKIPKTKVEDWREKREADLKEEFTLKKDIKIDKTEKKR